MSEYFPNQGPSYPQQNPEGHPSFPFPAATPPQQQGYPSAPFPATPQEPLSGSFPSASSFPSSYYSSPSYQQQQPQPKKSKARVILIVAAVLMFAAGGVFAGLYVATESDHDKATSVLDDKKSELSDVKKQITAAEDAKSTAEQSNSDLEAKITANTACVEATQHFLWDNLTDAESSAAIDAMWDACT